MGQTHAKNKTAFLIFLFLFFAYASTYVARINLSMASPSLIEMGRLSTQQIGLLGGVFSVVFACGRVINSSLSDIKRPLVMIFGGLLLCALVSFGLYFLPPFPAFLTLWGMNAYSSSMLWGSIIVTMSVIYEGVKAKRMSSILSASVPTGNIVAILLCTVIVEKIGPSYAFLSAGSIVLFFAVLSYFALKDIRPELKSAGERKSMFALLKDKRILYVLVPALFHGAIKDSVSLWMTVFFADKYDLALGEMAGYILFIPIAGLIGRFIYPAIFKLFRENELTTAAFGFAICVFASFVLVLGIGGPITAMLCLGFIYGTNSIVNATYQAVYPLRFKADGNVASAGGLIDLATYGGHGIASMIYGIMIASFGYTSMFLTWLIFSAVSAVVLYKVRNMP